MRPCFLLSPYRPPTSYPVSLAADEAGGWLAGYLAAWHPAAVAAVAGPPELAGIYDHDDPRDGALYVIPSGPHLYQPDDWNGRAAEVGAAVVRCGPDLDAARWEVLEALGADGPLRDADAATVRLFAGVGLGYLTVETLFDAASHEHLLDAAGFWADVQRAATAVAESRPDDVAPALRDAAEKLRSAREVVASSTAALLDYRIVTDPLAVTEWPASPALTVIASGEDVVRLTVEKPEVWAALKERSGRTELLGSVYRERDDAHLPAESQRWNLALGREVIAAAWGSAPTTYGRVRGELHAALPGWLRQAGYAAAVVTNLDGALSPLRHCTVAHWPGPDGRTVDVLCREPLPADEPSTFFNLAYHLYQATTRDAVPTLTLVHRDKPAALGYAELVALCELGDAVGAFQLAGEYLGASPHGEYLGAVGADDFFTDALDDRVSTRKLTDPVSGLVEHFRRRRRFDGITALAALHRALTPADPALDAELDSLEGRIESGEAVDLAPVEAAWAEQLAARVLARSQPGTPGLLVFNPCAVARRVGLELPPGPAPAPGGPLKAAQADADALFLVAELPALGYAWLPLTGAPAPAKSRILSAEGSTVRNEFFEAELDPATGALRVLRDTRTRVNRLGMQLVYQPGSTMRATSVTATRSGAALGEVTATGTLVDAHDGRLAGFELRLRAWAGRPGLEVRVTLTPERKPEGYPWHGYYGARFAYRDGRAALFRGAHGANAAAHGSRPGSADYVEVRVGGERSFVFTGGLPFAQKQGGRMLDVVLVPEGETATAFEFLLALDRDNPMGTSVGWTTPAPFVRTERGPPPSGPSGWLGHLDLPSLWLTSLRPERRETGRAVRARFLETAGYGGAADFRLARTPVSAALLRDDGGASPLALNGDAVPLEFSANEWVDVRLTWE